MGLRQRWKRDYPDLVRIFRLATYELEALAASWRGKLSPAQRRRAHALKGRRNLRLHLACGESRREGWVNIDASPNADLCVDLRRRMPLDDACASLIFCEHFCDHLNFPDEISRFLGECHRLLAPGGRARFVLHDAIDLMRACVERDARYFEIAEAVKPTMMESVNFLFRFEEAHQFLYDFETFERLLRAAGFSRVERAAYRKSEVPELVLDFELSSREVMSMYIEAIK